jgi:hypothetical protein
MIDIHNTMTVDGNDIDVITNVIIDGRNFGEYPTHREFFLENPCRHKRFQVVLGINRFSTS